MSNIYIYIYKSGYRGGGLGDCPPPEQFQGGDCPPPENCPPPEQFRGGQPKCPPLSDSGGGGRIRSGRGQKIFRALVPL